MSNSKERQEHLTDFKSKFSLELTEVTLASATDPGLNDSVDIADPAGSDWSWLTSTELDEPDESEDHKQLATKSQFSTSILGWVVAAGMAAIALTLGLTGEWNSTDRPLTFRASGQLEKIKVKGEGEANGITVKSPIDGFVFLAEFEDSLQPRFTPEFGQPDIELENGSTEPIRFSFSSPKLVLFVVTQTPAGEACRRWMNEKRIAGTPSDPNQILNELAVYLRKKGYLNLAQGKYENGEEK